MTDAEALHQLWRDVESDEHLPLFLSERWLGLWHASLPETRRPNVHLLDRDGRALGGALIGESRIRRHFLVKVRALHLNETGHLEHDCLTIEYNGCVARAQSADVAFEQLLIELTRHEPAWDELHLSGLPAELGQRAGALAEGLGLAVRLVARKPTYQVDLSALGPTNDAYLGSLSRNARQQVRRSMRLYEASGPLNVTAARDWATAEAYWNKLESLHQASWTRRGQPGAFAQPFFGEFHRKLIRAELGRSVDLLRVSAGARDIGYLYSLRAGGRIYAYQSGFDYPADSRMKPGLVSHYRLVDYYRAHGMAVYDFMAGQARYKETLGKRGTDLCWLVIYRKRPLLLAENMLRGLRLRARSLGRRARGWKGRSLRE